MSLIRGRAVVSVALLVMVGCGSSSEGNEASPQTPAPEPALDSGVTEGGNVVAPPPPKAGDVVKEGIFVSATLGADGADATPAHPLKTITSALALAKTKPGTPIIVCAETYLESITLSDGVTMYGYFDCSAPEWKRVAAKAKIVSPSSPGVVGENLLLPARFEGFDISTPNIDVKAAPGQPPASTYAMILRSSKNLVMSELALRPGKAQDGADGVQPAAGNAELSLTADGASAREQQQQSCSFFNPLYFCNFGTSPSLPGTGVSGGAGGTSQCKFGTNGGPGGDGGAARVIRDGQYRVVFPAPDPDGLPKVGNATTAKGGAYTGRMGWNSGLDGAAGARGTLGANGLWSLTDSGFVPGDGTTGGNGEPGSGGGGGSGAPVWFNPGSSSGQVITPALPAPNPPASGIYMTATGAGGGAGGCGGIAGTAGTGGGASIGLFLVATENISFTSSLVMAGKGGDAGKGTTGTKGTPGRSGGTHPAELAGSAGGNGGAGGDAGLSGHGAPGPSLAMVFKGPRPQTKDVDLIAGQAGAGADPLASDTQSLPAVVGIAKAEHSF
jgi:hypothetical protein